MKPPPRKETAKLSLPMPKPEILETLRRGVVIPATPLALTSERKLDERRQRALYRYYVSAGSGGVAVAVHSTQFEIREPQHALFRPVLEIGAEELNNSKFTGGRPIVKIAGVCGGTKQAVAEAGLARDLGFDAGLLSLAALKESSEDDLICDCREVSQVIPIIGFYLQPAVGGRVLPYSFWRRFAEIENVIAIKMAPFNRYQTFDVVRAVADAGRENHITLYTGNDDNIIADLVSPYVIQTAAGEKILRIRGGLLGQFCVWTKKAVELLDEIHSVVEGAAGAVPMVLLRKNIEMTDANAIIFDAAHKFAGCIPGIHEILRRQGLLANILCLNPHEILSPGQAEELTRIQNSYPWMQDDDFVTANLETWLQG
jgi:hypothetical protein